MKKPSFSRSLPTSSSVFSASFHLDHRYWTAAPQAVFLSLMAGNLHHRLSWTGPSTDCGESVLCNVPRRPAGRRRWGIFRLADRSRRGKMWGCS